MFSPATLRNSFSWDVAALPVARGMQLFSLGIMLLSLSSCGSGMGLKLPPKKPCIKVAGQVRVDGEPAEGVQIILHPTDEGHGLYQFPSGITDAGGEFKLRTYAKEDGAPAGNYVAVFTWPIPIDEQVDDDDRLKRLYRNPSQSTFKVTVDGTQVTLEPFDLKLKGLDGIPLTKSELKELKIQQKQQIGISAK